MPNRKLVKKALAAKQPPSTPSEEGVLRALAASMDWEAKNGRDPKRINRVLRLIRSLWSLYPDQRLGQLLDNYSALQCDRLIDDDEVEASLQKTLEDTGNADF